MRTTILILVFLGLIFGTQAQDNVKQEEGYKTIFGNGEVSHGGYGGISINYSHIGDNDAILAGARGAWIVNHRLGIGIGGYGFINDMSFNVDDEDGDTFLTGGYGGLLLEPVIAPNNPVHVSFPVLIGAGGIALVRDYCSEDYNGYHDCEYGYTEDSHAYFVIEPGAEIELNLIKYMRIAFGLSYRFTSDVVLANTSKTVLYGLSGGMTLKFGKF